jgi:hypothetical protein
VDGTAAEGARKVALWDQVPLPLVVPVTCAEGSSLSQWYNMPPAAPPRIGAIQNSQSWPIAQPPTKRAGPVERAGLTEVFVTGMLTRWISVRPRPIAIGAKPAGAFPCVEPMMMKRNIIVSTTSVTKAERRLY